MNQVFNLLDEARAAVVRTQNPKVAGLQRHLKLGHTVARALIIQLQNEGILLPAWPGRYPGLHPDFRRVHVQSVKGDPRLNYFERVIQLALFYFELSEEGFDAHSELGWAQMPAPGLDRREVQTMFRAIWYGEQKLSLTDAAIAFHTWLGARAVPFADREEAVAAITAGCLPYERTFRRVEDPHIRLDRAYIRLARCYRRMLREDFTRDSRIAEWCVPNDQAPHSDRVLDGYPEHVVPCAVLRDIALECYAEQWSVMHVAALLKRLLAIAWIPRSFKSLLDEGHENLKDRMTENWNPLSDCIYMRLHDRNIAVPLIPSHLCTCNDS